MAIGSVALKLGLSDKEFKTQLNSAVKSVKKSVDMMRDIMIAAKLGNILFGAAKNKMAENLKLVQLEISALAEGLSQSMIDSLKPVVDQFDYIGIGADQASEALYKFILQGKAIGLNSIGIYVDKDTQSMLAAMDATERFNWVLENVPDRLGNIMDKLDPTTKAFYEFEKKAKDVKEQLGMTFLGVIVNITNAFGGLTNTMKIALGAFLAYKTAMIIGNVAMGISKTIAMGGVFAAPLAIGMGVAAIGAIAGILAAGGIAMNALNNIPDPVSGGTTDINNSKQESNSSVVVIEKDRFGQTQKMLSERNGSNSNNIQTNYGANN